MNKVILVLLVLLVLSGCAQPVENMAYEQSNDAIEQKEILYVFGDLNVDKTLKNLNYKTSTCWQQMRSDVSDKLVGKYDEWSIAIYTDANLFMVFGYIADEETKITKDQDINTEIDNLIANQLKDKGYSFIETIKLDDRYGYIVDVSENKETKRVLYVNGNGGKYEISFGNQTDSLSALELQFAYDYFKSLHFNDSIKG